MKKKVYKKATMKVVNMECEHLLSGSGDFAGGPVMMSGTSASWSDLQ